MAESVQAKKRWTRRMIVWHWLQCRVNERARRTTGHYDSSHWLWKINDWLSDRWAAEWIERGRPQS